MNLLELVQKDFYMHVADEFGIPTSLSYSLLGIKASKQGFTLFFRNPDSDSFKKHISIQASKKIPILFDKLAKEYIIVALAETLLDKKLIEPHETPTIYSIEEQLATNKNILTTLKKGDILIEKTKEVYSSICYIVQSIVTEKYVDSEPKFLVKEIPLHESCLLSIKTLSTGNWYFLKQNFLNPQP